MARTDSGFFVQATGWPAVYGTKGNFEVLAPRLGGGANHYWRHNDDPNQTWYGPNLAFGSTYDVSEVALIHSTYGSLEAIVLEGHRLFHIWRETTGGKYWQSRAYLPGSAVVVGRPALIQSRFGTIGNLEVVAPVAGGGMAHWWREDDQPSKPWHGPYLFGSGSVSAVGLVQSNFGSSARNLEVIARVGNQLIHYWRADIPPYMWYGGTVVANNVTGSPGFIQSNYGTKGNFEIVAPVPGGMAHWWRDNDDPSLPWYGNGAAVLGRGGEDAVSLIQSNYDNGNLEVIARDGLELRHYWRDTTGAWVWHGTTRLPMRSCKPWCGGDSILPYRTDNVVGIHSGMLHTGKVLLFGFQYQNSGTGLSCTLDLDSAAVNHISTGNQFCSGHSFLPDGRLFVAGGHHHQHDIRGLHVFDPNAESWTHLGEMNDGRWYPTCTTLADGNIFIISGSRQGGRLGTQLQGGGIVTVNNDWEIREGGGGEMANGACPIPFSNHFPPGLSTIDLYPFVYVVPRGNGTRSGKLFIHSRNTTRFLNPANGVWDAAQHRTVWPHSRSYPGQGTSVLLPLWPDPDGSADYKASVLILGGGGKDTWPASDEVKGDTPATNTAEILDLSETSPAWRNTYQPMNRPRIMHDAVLLPDGTVLVVGGSSTGAADHGKDPVLDVEIFDPVTETFSLVCSVHVPRIYHSTAVLLPDASVLIAGKDGDFNDEPFKYPEYRGEVFRPPYLHRGDRPAFGGPFNTNFGYNRTIDIPTTDDTVVGTIVMIRQGAVTHSFNMDQRFVGLRYVAALINPTGVRVVTPFDATVAPPGKYLLFLVSPDGVPSEGVWVTLR